MTDISPDELKRARAIVETQRRIEEDAEVLEQTEKVKAMVGRRWAVQDSYGSGDSWTIYQKVVSAKGLNVVLERYSVDCYGSVRIEQTSTGLSYLGLVREKEISEKQFQAGRKRVMGRLRA